MVRKYGVWIALVLTLAACYWVTIQGDEHVENVVANEQKTRSYSSINSSLSGLTSNALREGPGFKEHITLRAADLRQPQDLFAALDVNNADADLAENPIPIAPSNPYTYAGKISEDNSWTVFLTDGMNNFSVKTGDALQGGWHVKHIQNEEITLVYQPLKQEFKMKIGATL